MMMSLLLLALVVPLTPRIHTIIRTLREPVLALSVVRDDGTVHGARIIGRDTADHDTVRSR